jgi:TATA-box binding protein (TBP) (component of TFIID and TFIIIB)
MSKIPIDSDDEIDIFDLLKAFREKQEPTVDISPLIVSVCSAKANMNTSLELKDLSKRISEAVNKNIIQAKKKDFAIRGVIYKDTHAGEISKPSPRKKGQFPNNMGVLVRSPYKIEDNHRHIYIRVFKNGSISMTGCKIKEDGIAVVKILENFIKKQKSLFSSEKERKNFEIGSFELTMINSNYLIGFKIDRNRLFEHFDTETKLFCSYKPNIYAGVKIGFFYNSIKDEQDGVCSCPNSVCTLKKSSIGKGSGNGEGQCKKVTIAIFETGKIVITGGRNITQARAAYNYINQIIKTNAKDFSLIQISDIKGYKDF